ncbi:transmembrane protein, putative (macronuclear) [Tetrahymena thermophila SB210]|uniref:Transmembrane protein, putative n=1 Tax=Tetrahymena thermophila (strain SB210) TaxID=312017 RepID=Q228T7_TETTS|nr:transmembrane protein, putative [Tetrahymena thermophila SB210]EAR81798.1 transmembrane protein, putative [Tetrahymena thermophila SB210]|eukprot:XP_001029461.1 transmembrane protein, putative [Tetrahymena thermophila SB210]
METKLMFFLIYSLVGFFIFLDYQKLNRSDGVYQYECELDDIEENEQHEANRIAKHQKVLEILERVKANGGQCFLDAIAEVNKSTDYNYHEFYEYQLFCLILRCGIEEDVPSAELFSSCIETNCYIDYGTLSGYYSYSLYIFFIGYHFELIYSASIQVDDCLKVLSSQFNIIV